MKSNKPAKSRICWFIIGLAEREVIELSTLHRCISISYKGLDSLLTELLTFSFAIYNAVVKVRKEDINKPYL